MKQIRAALFSLVFALPAWAALAPSPEEVKPLQRGAKSPITALVAPGAREEDLAAILGGKPTIVIFFRGGWCPFCSRQMALLGEHELDLRALGYQIVGVTAEPVEKLAATAAANHVRYHLFSDRGARASQAFGVAYRLSTETGKAYRENGIELSAASDGNGFWLPVPAAFIIDGAGTIRFVYFNADPSIRISWEELLAAAKSAADAK